MAVEAPRLSYPRKDVGKWGALTNKFLRVAHNEDGTLKCIIGTDVQAWDAGLDDIAALAVSNGNIIVGDGANWIAESGNTARTSLGLGSGDSPTITGLTISGITQGSVLFAGASGVLSQDNSNFFYDDANNTLRVKRQLSGGVY